MKDNKISALYSWPVIILALFFFWPVGLFLIFKRVSIDKKAALNVGKLLGICGAVSYGFAIIGLLACLSDGFGSDDIGMILFFAIAGFVLRKVGKNMKAEAESVKQYLTIIVNGNVRQMDNIAATTGKSYDVVKADIQKMIKKGYLKNAYIDENTREVVLPNSKTAQAVLDDVSVPAHTATVEKVAPKVVVCPCCGANNTIYGDSGECEYCGSTIN